MLTDKICSVPPHNKGDTHTVDQAELLMPPVNKGLWEDTAYFRSIYPVYGFIELAIARCGYERQPVAISHQNEDGEHILVFFEAPKSSADMYREYLEEGK